jgi:protein phosphatase
VKHTIRAACHCHTGRIRKKNEDNFFFGGRCLEQEHNGLAHPIQIAFDLQNSVCMAVFDGMGGENFGEMASFSAAKAMQQAQCVPVNDSVPEAGYLDALIGKLNEAVLLAQRRMLTERMGTTVAGLYFRGGHVYAFNLGDSRVYRLRSGELLQLSLDHTDKRPAKVGRKPALTQYLGIDPEDFELEPHVAKETLCAGDRYLLCSDGLSDLLTIAEIAAILGNARRMEDCVQDLVHAALARGGRDNITAITCEIETGNI